MEKRAVIEEGRTPPEADEAGKKEASAEDLEKHATTRLASAAENVVKTPAKGDKKCTP